MCDVTGHSHWIDNVRCKMHQTCLQVKRTSRLRLKRKFKCFKRKRKITNAKIYEDKRDLYCMVGNDIVDIHQVSLLVVFLFTQQVSFSHQGNKTEIMVFHALVSREKNGKYCVLGHFCEH